MNFYFRNIERLRFIDDDATRFTVTFPKRWPESAFRSRDEFGWIVKGFCFAAILLCGEPNVCLCRFECVKSSLIAKTLSMSLMQLASVILIISRLGFFSK